MKQKDGKYRKDLRHIKKNKSLLSENKEKRERMALKQHLKRLIAKNYQN